MTELKTGRYVDDAKTRALTPEGVLSFVYAFKPQEPNARNQLKEPKYSTSVLFPADADLTLLKELAGKALREKFGSKMDDPDFTAKLRNPFRDQGEKDFDGYVKGNKYIIASSDKEHPPIIVDGNRDEIKEPRHVYAGAKGRLMVSVYAYDTAGNRGVAFGLLGVQKTGDGPALGGGGSAQPDSFSPVEGTPKQKSEGASSVFD